MKKNKTKQNSKSSRITGEHVDPALEMIKQSLITLHCMGQGCLNEIDLCYDHYKYLVECYHTFHPSEGLPAGWSGIYLDFGNDKRFLIFCPKCSEELVDFLGINDDE